MAATKPANPKTPAPRLHIDPATGATVLAPKPERTCKVCHDVLTAPVHAILPPHPDWHAFEE